MPSGITAPRPKHSGFNVHIGRTVAPEDRAEREELCQYDLRNPFSVEKITLESPTDTVIYRSKLNPKINRNYEIFEPVEFLATLSQHIPDTDEDASPMPDYENVITD